MYSSLFYKLSWNAQFAAGIVLFTLSCLIEFYVLAQYLDNEALALALAGALELSKALSIVFYRFMKDQTAVHYPPSVAASLLAFRFALLALSLACSVMYFAGHLDRPNLEPVRAADAKRVERDYGGRIAELHSALPQRRAQAEQALAARYRSQAERLEERYLPAIRELEALLSQEMDNASKGVFIGPRYREIERRLGEEKARHDAALKALGAAEQAERARLVAELGERHEGRLEALRAERETRLAAVRRAGYRGDERVENPMLTAVLGLVNAVFGTALTPLEFVCLFSLFLSLIMELGIVVIFEHIALSYMPLFQAEHAASLSLNKRRIQAEGELQEEGIEDAVLREQVERERERIERRMRRAAEKLSA